MKPSADAFAPAGAAPPSSAAEGAGGSSRLAVPGSVRLDPVRDTKDDIAPDAMSSAVIDVGDPVGQDVFGEPADQDVFGEPADQDVFGEPADQDVFGESAGRNAFGEPAGQDVSGDPAGRNAFGEPAGQDVSGDPAGRNAFGEPAGQDVSGDPAGQDVSGEPAGQDVSGEPVGRNAFGEPVGQDVSGDPAGQDAFGEPVGRNAFGERWPGPIHATRDDPAAAALGDRFTAFGTSSPDGSVRPAHRPPAERLDAGGSRSAAYRTFDPRALPRRSGAGRIVATVLSVLAVAGAMAGGGHFVWKTELVRPALVRHQPPMPVPDMEPVPMHTADTAADMAADAASGAAPRTDERLQLPTPESAQAPPERPGHFVRVSAEAPDREDAVRVRAVPSTRASTSDRVAGSRTLPVVGTAESERVERAPAPARERRSPEPSPSVFPSGQPGRAGLGDRDHLPAVRAAARAGAVEPPVRATGREHRSPAPSPSVFPSGQPGRAGLGDRDHLPAVRAAARAGAVEPPVRATGREHRSPAPSPSVFPSGQPGRAGLGDRDHLPAVRAAARAGAVEPPVRATGRERRSPAPSPSVFPSGQPGRVGAGDRDHLPAVRAAARAEAAGAVEPPVRAAGRERRSPEPSPSVFPSGQPGRAGLGDRDHLPAVRAAARAEAAGAVEPPMRAAAGGRPDPADSPEPGPAPAGAGPRSGSGGGIEIRKRVRPDHVATLIERAYEMFRAGHVEPAAQAYRAVLGHEPRNRDALLGLAAVAAREGRWEEAAGRYGQALASNPADTVAQAALIAIDEQDPMHGERRLKALLRSEPRAAYLHFNLGNVYAAQSRWSEAQRSYLDAWHLDSGNADYAYNLAVSLDHLARRESALDFYREALALARSRPASFETAAAVARIRDMEASPGGAVATGRSLPEPAGAAPDGPTAAGSTR